MSEQAKQQFQSVMDEFHAAVQEKVGNVQAQIDAAVAAHDAQDDAAFQAATARVRQEIDGLKATPVPQAPADPAPTPAPAPADTVAGTQG